MPGTGFKYLPRKFLHATCCFIFSNSSWSSIFWKYVMHKKNKQHQKDVLLALPRDSSLASKTCVFCRTQTQHPGTLPEQSKHNERYKIPRRTLACIQIHTPKPSTVHPGSWRPSFLSRAPEKSQAHFTLTTFEVAILFRGAMNFGFPEVPFFGCACRCSAVSTRTPSEWSLSQSCRIGSISAIRSSGNAMPSSSPHKGKHFFRSSVPSIQLPVLSFALQLSGHSGCVSYRTPCACVSKQSRLWRA